MDYKTFCACLADDENFFEKFCHEAVPKCVLEGDAGKGYQKAPKGGPFDGEAFGSYRDFAGTILFEYKGGKDRNKIKKDLLDNKLIRAAELRPQAKAYVLVMGGDQRTDDFEQDLTKFIAKHKFPFELVILAEDVVKGWIDNHPSLLHAVLPDQEDSSLEAFINRLIEQHAPVDFRPYHNLDRLYVPPAEYDDIISKLLKHRIVFLIGPPHVGKTFTATSILRYFHSRYGYEPRWILPKDYFAEAEQEKKYRFRSQEPPSLAKLITANVGAKKITYVEDPFGRTGEEEVRWEFCRPEEVLRELIRFVQADKRDPLVIVTSRENLFEKSLAADLQLDKLIVRLNSGQRIHLALESYTKQDKRNLLHNYSQIFDCTWHTPDPYQLPADVIAADLPTPHSIAYFCEQSVAARFAEERASHLKAAGQELIFAFMDEIADLDEATLTVLITASYFRAKQKFFAAAFPRLSGHDATSTWKQAILKLSNRVHVHQSMIEFFHSAYREALHRSVTEILRVRALFYEMAASLANHSNVDMRKEAVRVLAENFINLNHEGRQLLAEFVADIAPEVREIAAGALARNFKHLDFAERKLLWKFGGDPEPEVREVAAGVLARNFKQLDPAERKLLWKFGGDPEPEVHKQVIGVLVRNFQDFGLEGRQLLRELGANPKPEVRKEMAGALADNFKDLDSESRKLLRELGADHEPEVRWKLAVTLAWKAKYLDPEGWQLLREFRDDPEIEVRKQTVWAIDENFEDLDPEDGRLLRKLGADPEPELRKQVAETLASNFAYLDNEDRRLLLELGADHEPEVRKEVAQAMAGNFNNLDHKCQQLLRVLVADPEAGVCGEVAWVLAWHFENLDHHGRQLLMELGADPEPEVRKAVAWALARNVENYNDEGKELLNKLQTDREPEVRRAAEGDDEAEGDKN